MKTFILLLIALTSTLLHAQGAGISTSYISLKPSTLPTRCRQGDLRVDNSSFELQMCNNSNTWSAFGNVGGGGTGLNTATPHSVIVGNGTSPFTQVGPGTSGYLFTGAGASSDPAFTQLDLGSSPAITGTLSLTNGGTGQATAQAAMNSLAGAVTATRFLRGDGTNVTMSAIQTGDVPTLNQNTSGTAAGLSSTLAITSGGTGQTSANAALNALLPSQSGQSGNVLGTNGTSTSWIAPLVNPMTTGGDLIYGGTSGAATRLANGTSGQLLQSAGSTSAPAWQTIPGNATALKARTTQKFTTTGSTTGYLFTISTSTTCAVGDTYTNNGNTYTVIYALSAQSGQVLFMSNSAAPLSSGTLTRATGSGTSSVTFTANLALGTYTTPTSPSPLYLVIEVQGGGGGGGGSGTSGTGNGSAANPSAFGPYISGGGGPGLIGSGGAAQAGGAGGTASSAAGAATISFPGGTGQGSIAPAGTPAGFIPGGSGGNGFFGGAGQGSPNTTGTAGATNTGSGGSGGGGNSSTFAGSGGGAGAYSRIIIASPLASTYPYVIGGGGGAGGAGTSGNAGGAGAAGIVIVEEHYQ